MRPAHNTVENSWASWK